MNDEAVNTLLAVLPGSQEQRRRFVKAAEFEIRAYRDLTIPFSRQRELDAHRIDKLASAAIVFAKAADAAAGSGWLFEQKIMMNARRAGMKPDAALTHAASELAEIDKAANIAKRIAKVAATLKREARPLKPQAALKSLVTHFAIAFGRIYGYRPSAAGMGYFARVVAVIFKAEGIASGDEPPGQAWLQSVIDNPQVQAFPPPRRSRKSNSPPR